MKYIIAGTDRPGSKTLQVAKYVQALYARKGETVEIIDLAQLKKADLDGFQYGGKITGAWGEAIDKVDQSTGLIIVIPEYNGSYPGILKVFVDYWKYPETFEHRPICYIGLGGLFGGMRSVEHLQTSLGYRNTFNFPQRVFLQNIWRVFDGTTFSQPVLADLLDQQATGFQKFVRALESEQLDTLSVLKNRTPPMPVQS
ncbi:MAG: NAD(P)H-dependent oxidoreductase [Bdellovibrionaceae bacterium]|nr:NAD(P)H-dependent oxidoreductase [Pseudobdellovibrionaceae bacterium]